MFGGPIGLTPDALDPAELGSDRPRSRVLRALQKERRQGKLGGVHAFVQRRGTLWTEISYGEEEARAASILRRGLAPGAAPKSAGGEAARPAEWLASGNAEALSAAHAQAVPLVTCCALTQQVARRMYPGVEVHDGWLMLEPARWLARRLAS